MVAARRRRRLIPLLLGLGAASFAATAVAQPPRRYELTFAVRIADAAGKPVEVHLALPPETPHQRVVDITTNARGLTADVVRGDEPEVVFRGRVGENRRVSVTAIVDVDRRDDALPASVQPVQEPPIETLAALRPAPLLPSRSILVREFLETHAAPRLRAGDGTDMLRAIYGSVRDELTYKPDGKSLALDVLRRGDGKRIGLERVFTASLRSAGIPAHLVEGIDPQSTTRRKRRFWTEVWAEGQWYPVSASYGWLAKPPRRQIALTFDGRRVLSSLGAGTATYGVVARRLKSPAPQPTAPSENP